MENRQIAKIFEEIGELLELKGENVFKVRAYQRAAQNIDGLSQDVAALSAAELEAIPGIGKDLAAKIREYAATGEVAKHEALRKEFPAGVLALLRVPGLGPKTVMMLTRERGIRDIDELEALARAGKLTGLPGIQKKTEENILKGIELVRRGSERRPLGRVRPLAEEIVRAIRDASPVDRVEVAGSIRRWKETVNDIDILATSRQPTQVMDAFVKLPQVRRVLMHGETRASILTDQDIQVDLRVVDEGSYGAALQYFTGGKQHNIKLRELAGRAGLKINEYGVFREPGEKRIAGRTEEEVYRALGLPCIPPELREDTGEVEAAQTGMLPGLVELGDIKGDLHIHTKWSDGSHDLDTIVRAARERGYRYIAVTDHTKGLGVAHGLDGARLAEQGRLIDRLNATSRGFRVLKGTEVDIRSDGTLDLPDDVLAGLDIVVASVHSGFKQSREQITKRLLAAVRHPCVNVIAHPTGRLLGERDAYAVDLDAILKEAARHGVAMEINAYPLRLDLNDSQIRMAKGYGGSLVISTDSHVTAQLDTMIYGVAMARRGWVERDDILNTREYGPLLDRLKSCRLKKT
ncbi:MAG: DNA polymerase/3'-5' exonuclease PolX [Syntrophales bacterium]